RAVQFTRAGPLEERAGSGRAGLLVNGGVADEDALDERGFDLVAAVLESQDLAFEGAVARAAALTARPAEDIFHLAARRSLLPVAVLGRAADRVRGTRGSRGGGRRGGRGRSARAAAGEVHP